MRPPDPHLKACLAVLYHALIESRRFCFVAGGRLRDRLSGRRSRQAADVLDAAHNLPWLIENWERCDQERLRQDLGSYKRRWREYAGTDLLAIYEQTLCRAEHGCDGRFEVVDTTYLTSRGFIVIGEIEGGIVAIGQGIVKPCLPEGLKPVVSAVEAVRRDGRGQTGLVFACPQEDAAKWQALELRGQTLELSIMDTSGHGPDDR